MLPACANHPLLTWPAMSPKSILQEVNPPRLKRPPRFGPYCLYISRLSRSDPDRTPDLAACSSTRSPEPVADVEINDLEALRLARVLEWEGLVPSRRHA